MVKCPNFDIKGSKNPKVEMTLVQNAQGLLMELLVNGLQLDQRTEGRNDIKPKSLIVEMSLNENFEGRNDNSAKCPNVEMTFCKKKKLIN